MTMKYKTQIRIYIIVDELLDGRDIDGFNKYEFEVTLKKDGMDINKARELMNRIIEVAKNEK